MKKILIRRIITSSFVLLFSISTNSYASVSTEVASSIKFDSIVINKLDGTGKCRAELSEELSQEILNYGQVNIDIGNDSEKVPSCLSSSDEVVLLPALIFGCIGGVTMQAFMHRTTEDSLLFEKLTQFFGGALGVYAGNVLTPDILDDLHKVSKIGRNLTALSGVALAGASGIVCAEVMDTLI